MQWHKCIITVQKLTLVVELWSCPPSLERRIRQCSSQVGSGTHYAIPICSKFYKLCFKLCPKFVYYAQTVLEGANLYVQIIALLCCVQHHNFITNLKPGLGAYGEIYTSRLQLLYLSHHVRTLSPGPARACVGWDTSQSETMTQGLDTAWG